MGFDNALVVSREKPSGDLICSICNDLVDLDAVVTTQCSHVHCRLCLTTWFEKSRSETCPICKHDKFVLLYHARPTTHRTLRTTRVKCPLSSHHGIMCKWEGQYQNLKTHLLSGTSHHCPGDRPIATSTTSLNAAAAAAATTTGATSPPTPLPPLPLDPKKLIGRSFHRTSTNDSDGPPCFFSEVLTPYDEDMPIHPSLVKFTYTVDDEIMTDLIPYDLAMRYVSASDENETLWKVSCLNRHTGPFKKGDPAYRNSRFNVEVEWMNGEVDEQPLNKMIIDDPRTCYFYAKKENLLNIPEVGNP
jgi:Ring finger domain